MATPIEDPTGVHVPAMRPTPMTAVATDGSQIYPDRHLEPHVYLINISEIAFQYGTLEKPVMRAMTTMGPGPDEMVEHRSGAVLGAKDDMVTARRDQMELDALFNLAEAARKPNRPIVCFADGTLIRWMLQRIDLAPVQSAMIAMYAHRLACFREQAIPLCSVISMPNNTEVVNLIRGLRGETAEWQEDSFAGILDRRLYDALLEPWQRTAVFESASHVLKEYAPQDRICFFYVKVQTRHGGIEMARVEVPHWVVDNESVLRLVHAAVVSECGKGDGYPMILGEAHQHAVIRMQDRQLFYRLVERALKDYDVRTRASRKQFSKQRPVV